MTAIYERLGLRAAHRFPRQGGTEAWSQFERQLRDIETGAPALNLSFASVHLAAEIACFATDLDDEKRVALILLVVISLAALEEGSTRFPVTGPESAAPMRRLLAPLCGKALGTDSIERMRAAIEELLSSGSATAVIGSCAADYKPLIYLPPFVYQHRILSAEIALARKLTTILESPNAHIAPERVRDLLSEVNTQSVGSLISELSQEQRRAIECAAISPLTIVSGGPGTGKTSIVVAILKVLTGAGIDPGEIALAAPTGKAANRIAESMRARFIPSTEPAGERTWPEPSTLHRLLGYSPTLKRFRHHRNNPLTARVIIVDEGSMLDLELMSHLLDAMRPEARLVILGDADQLPSVSAGAVFRDLMATGEDGALTPKSVRLTRNYRTDRAADSGYAIRKLAGDINAGVVDLFDPECIDGTLLRRASVQHLQFVGTEWLEGEAVLGAFLERWYTERVHLAGDAGNRIFIAREEGFEPAECEAIRRVFDQAAQSRLLCVTRALEFGAEPINAALHRRRAFEEGRSTERAQFIAGEPVMVLRNDYSRMLFNGDQGVVLRVQRSGFETGLMAVFPRGDNFVAFGVGALKSHLELCYAMTVHKAQGSEFDAVAVMLPDKDLPLLTREILYTAVSRARSSVIIVGSRDIILSAVSRRIERYSGLREQLAQCLSETQRA